MTNTGVQRIYSDDNKIWLGMTRADANKSGKNIEVFNYANLDGDDEISQQELDRYNIPLFTEKFSNKKGKTFIQEYYPGLMKEDVSEEGIRVFNCTDYNDDGILSKEEVEKLIELRKKLEATNNKVENIKETKAKIDKIIPYVSFSGALLFALTAKTVSGGVEKTIFSALGSLILLPFINKMITESIANHEVDKLREETNNHCYVWQRTNKITTFNF